MQYLIDILRTTYHNGSIKLEQQWHSTHDDRASADAEISILRDDPYVCEISLVAWRSGFVEPNKRCIHGNGSRSVAGGIPIQRIEQHLSRPIIREVFANSPLVLSGYVFGGWSEVSKSVGLSPTTQPAPGYTLRPEKQLGKPINIIAGLRATSTDANVSGPVTAMIRGKGWETFEKVFTPQIG